MPADTPESKGPQKPSLSWSQPAQTSTPAQKPQEKKEMPKPAAVSAAPKGNGNRVLWWIVGGVIILGLIIWGLVALHDQNTQPNTTSTGTTTTTGASTTTQPSSSASFLTAPSPQAAGTEVTVANVSVTNPTWVVVYEDNNGKPGNALGAGLFFSPSQGGATSGTVTLLRGTVAGQSYLVGESLDNGDRVFSLQSDKPVTDMSGAVLWAHFTAQ